METMGRRIFNRRIHLNMTQQYVADKVGVSRVAVTKWESGQTGNLKLDNLMGLCKLLNLSIEYLIRGGEFKTYIYTTESPSIEVLNQEFGFSKVNMSIARTHAHQELDKIQEKDLPHVQKILGTYDGVERRSKPRSKRKGNSNK